MFSHRLITTLAAAAMALALMAAIGPAASAQGDDEATAASRGVDVNVVGAVATFVSESNSTGAPVTVVLAGATGPHTLETAGALAMAVGKSGSPVGWTVVNDVGLLGATGPVFVIADGPGDGATVSVSTENDRTMVTLTGEASQVTALAYALAEHGVERRDSTGIDVVVPLTWTHETIADALNLIAGLAAEGTVSSRLVTDMGADPHRDLIVIGDSTERRLTDLAGEDATPTILAYADEKSPALAVSAPLADPTSGFPLGAVALAAAVAAMVSVAGGLALRRRNDQAVATLAPAS